MTNENKTLVFTEAGAIEWIKKNKVSNVAIAIETLNIVDKEAAKKLGLETEKKVTITIKE